MIVDREVFCPQCADAGRQTFLMQVIVTDHVVLRTIEYRTTYFAAYRAARSEGLTK